MRCPDCEMETNDIVKTKGICKLCYKRIYSMQERGLEYVKLKDIKGTKEYNRAMGRRLAAIERNKNKDLKSKTNKKSNKVETSIIAMSKDNTLEYIKNKAKEEVLKDINHFKKSKDLKEFDLNYNQLVIGFDLLYTILISDFDRAIDLNKQMYDSLMIDYIHEMKPNNILNSLEEYALHGAKEAYLQELRTPIIYLDKINSILNETFAILKLDNNFMANLKDTKVKLDEFLKTIENKVYLTTTPSMQKYDFVVSKDKEEARNLSIPHIQNKYSARLSKVRGLYGDMSYKPFDYKPPIYADSKEEAKEMFVEILLRDFSSLSYDTDDIQISYYTEKEGL